MKLILDILQGIGPGVGRGHPARSCPPSSPARSRAPTSASTSTARRSPSSSRPCSCSPSAIAMVARRSSSRAARSTTPAGERGAARHRDRPRRAAVRRRRSTTATRVWWPGLIGGAAVRRSAPAPRVRDLFAARPRAAGRARRAAALPIYAEGGRPSCSRRSRSSSRRSAIVAIGFFVVAARRRPAARGREVRGAADPPVSALAAKLVLAVIDGLKPAMLERAVATGRAPALQAVMERGTYVDECCAAFPSVTPVCAASIATGDAAGPPPDPVDELVPPRGAPLRRVRVELQRRRGASGSPASSPTPSST